MSNKIALCVDSSHLENPSSLGVEDQQFLDQTWILPFTDALIARHYLQHHTVDEAWVVSNNSLDGINLAAALKKDQQNRTVRLFLASPSGSKMSRCQTAGIVPICGNVEFSRIFELKRQALDEKSITECSNNAAELHEETLQDTNTNTSTSPNAESFEYSEDEFTLDDIPRQTSESSEDKCVSRKETYHKKQPALISDALPHLEEPDSESASPVSVSRIVRNNQTGTLELDSLEGQTATEQPLGLRNNSPQKSTSSGAVARLRRASTCVTTPLPVVKKAIEKEVAENQLPTTSAQKQRLARLITHENAHRNSQESEGARIVSVVSGSGGSGKSSVAALVALQAQRRGIKTLLFDADFQFGDMKYVLGYKQALDANALIDQPEQIETLLKTDSWPALLAAPEKLEDSETMEANVGELLAYLKPHFDLIVINTTTFWNETQLNIIEASNHVFFMLDQRPSSVRACNHALDLCARCGIATTSFSYLLNFCSKKSLLSALDVSCALKGAKVYEIKDGGTEVGELMGAGMAHKLAKLNNPLCTSIEKLLEETLYERIKPSNEPEKEAAETPHKPNATRIRLLGRQKKLLPAINTHPPISKGGAHVAT